MKCQDWLVKNCMQARCKRREGKGTERREGKGTERREGKGTERRKERKMKEKETKKGKTVCKRKCEEKRRMEWGTHPLPFLSRWWIPRFGVIWECCQPSESVKEFRCWFSVTTFLLQILFCFLFFFFLFFFLLYEFSFTIQTRTERSHNSLNFSFTGCQVVAAGYWDWFLFLDFKQSVVFTFNDCLFPLFPFSFAIE